MCFAVDGGGSGDDPGVDIDLEQPVGVTGQAVGDRVIGGVQVKGVGGQADRGAHDHILVDCIGGRIAVGRRRDIELIQIVDGDREVLRWRSSHRCCWPAP